MQSIGLEKCYKLPLGLAKGAECLAVEHEDGAFSPADISTNRGSVET